MGLGIPCAAAGSRSELTGMVLRQAGEPQTAGKAHPELLDFRIMRGPWCTTR